MNLFLEKLRADLFLWYGRWPLIGEGRWWCRRMQDFILAAQSPVHAKRLVISEKLRRQSVRTEQLGTDGPCSGRLLICKVQYSDTLTPAAGT